MAKLAQNWRVIDIVTASVLGIATGLIFWVWNGIGYAWYAAANALTPGFGGIAAGIWLLGGVLGGLIIRKPFAAIYVELLAAIVSAVLGNQWGIETVYSGLAQGIGAELIFLFFAYKRFGLPVAALAGVGAGVGAFVLEFFLSANYAKSVLFNVSYLISLSISGAILAGVVGYYLVKALAATGVLDRFGAGREARKLV
ncbi:ECF transporter S component [Corynebacterium pseudopelargi]|uniref:HMP/thiamine permease protein YkoE n=1 Tax=Corynebacterium pseudopelargi TaxID=2080757 RepID=A0A3G6J0A3_9CORY|nr:ECF transporter S component [Corynebacterium pseudopelargi]AZA09574.1 Putative HMP/thiamine permease protein YkoE [Corynebacterium pseudopelargi]